MTAPRGARPLHRLGLHEPLLRNGYALVLNVGLTTVLGVAFWVVAARYYSPADVGRGSALVSALLLLANFGQLGMANGLIRFLPAAGRHAAGLLARTYTLSACWSAVLGLGFVLLAPRLSPEFGFLDDRLFPALALSGAVLVWALFALQDAAIVGLRHAVWIPLENGAYGLLKLGLLLPFAAVMPGVGVFAAWVLAAAALIIPVNYAIFRRWMPSHAQHTTPEGEPVRRLRTVLRFVTFDYAGQACFMLATSALPLLVVATLGTVSNGYFYITWTIAVSLDLLSINLAQSLTVEASLRPGNLPGLLRRVLPRLALLQGAAVTALFAGAPLLLSLYGAEYAEKATTLLRLLAVAVLPRAVVVVTLAVARVQRRMGRILAVQAATMVGVLGLCAVLVGPLGLRGVGAAWLLTQLILASVLLSGLLRSMQQPTAVPELPPASLSPAPPPPAGAREPIGPGGAGLA
jgi:O-antigen/teichoic acid export membrane protein